MWERISQFSTLYVDRLDFAFRTKNKIENENIYNFTFWKSTNFRFKFVQRKCFFISSFEVTLPVATLQTNARAQKCHSKRRIHSKGNLSNRQTMMNWPKYEAIRAKVTNSWTTISHPGSSFSRINRYSSPYKAWHPWNKWSYKENKLDIEINLQTAAVILPVVEHFCWFLKNEWYFMMWSKSFSLIKHFSP